MPVPNRTDAILAFSSLRASQPPASDRYTTGRSPRSKNTLRDLCAPLRTLRPYTGTRR